MSIDVNAAEVSAEAAGQGSARYATAVQGLHDGLASVGPVGNEDSDLATAVTEFTGLLMEVADRTAQAYGSTADVMAASVAEARSADVRATEAP
jgi:hypothetical protein